MRRVTSSPLFTLVFLATIVALHVAGSFLGWYENVGTYADKGMHLLGGAWVGSFALYARRTYPQAFGSITGTTPLILFILGSAALIGIGWELFEFVTDRFAIQLNSPLRAQGSLADTLGDLVSDIAGALLLAVGYVRAKR